MPTETVVLVHGLWMNGMDMLLLGRRLRRAGYQVHRFHYSSLQRPPRANAAALQDFLQSVPGHTVHFVCHSLGGLVVRHLFHDFPAQRPGRVVTLGTPHKGSSAAKQLTRIPSGRRVLGQSIEHGLLGELPPWPPERELGSIAGDLRLGMGLLIRGIPAPSDGTVAVAETRLDGMHDHIVVHASHFGLLFSRKTEHYIETFLKTGSFGRG